MHGRNLLDDLENAIDESGQELLSQHFLEGTDKWWYDPGNPVEQDLSNGSNGTREDFGGHETTNDISLHQLAVVSLT